MLSNPPRSIGHAPASFIRTPNFHRSPIFVLCSASQPACSALSRCPFSRHFRRHWACHVCLSREENGLVRRSLQCEGVVAKYVGLAGDTELSRERSIELRPADQLCKCNRGAAPVSCRSPIWSLLAASDSPTRWTIRRTDHRRRTSQYPVRNPTPCLKSPRTAKVHQPRVKADS